MTFALDLTKIVEKAKGKADAVVRKIVLDLGAKLVYRSPVGDATLWKSPPPPGYSGGRFRANWQYQFNSAPSGELPDIDKTGGASNKRIASGVNSSPAIGVHYIVNNLPYAQSLERGHSTQAPQGMVGLAVVEFQNIVKEAAR